MLIATVAVVDDTCVYESSYNGQSATEVISLCYIQ